MVAGVQPIKYLLILLLCASCAGNPEYVNYDSMDYGLPKTPNKSEFFDVETGDGYPYGISNKDTFLIDVNHDGKNDKIIRGRFSNITAHGYTFYEIELDDGTKIDVPNFRTVEGADCFLTAYKFHIAPFVITKASRPLGAESWIQPTSATLETYKINGDKIIKISEKQVAPLCDVRELL